MRRIILMILLSLIILHSTCNAQTYTFNVSSETYNNLTSATIINREVWGNEIYYIPLGFEFLYFDSYIDTLVVYEKMSCLLISDNLENTKYINAFGATLMDRGEPSGVSQSQISYRVLNEPGNRIFIVEWNNFGFEGDYWCNDISTDYVNFQIWLYETTNLIEFRYGPSRTVNFQCSFWDEPGPSVSLCPWGNYNTNQISDSTIWLAGPCYDPVMLLSGDFNYYINGMIANGTVYSFENLLTSTKEILPSILQFYPNPVNDFLTIKTSPISGPCLIEIVDVNGNILLQQKHNINNGILDIPLSGVSPGIKYLRLITDNTSFGSPFIKL